MTYNIIKNIDGNGVVDWVSFNSPQSIKVERTVDWIHYFVTPNGVKYEVRTNYDKTKSGQITISDEKDTYIIQIIQKSIKLPKLKLEIKKTKTNNIAQSIYGEVISENVYDIKVKSPLTISLKDNILTITLPKVTENTKHNIKLEGVDINGQLIESNEITIQQLIVEDIYYGTTNSNITKLPRNYNKTKDLEFEINSTKDKYKYVAIPYNIFYLFSWNDIFEINHKDKFVSNENSDYQSKLININGIDYMFYIWGNGNYPALFTTKIIIKK